MANQDDVTAKALVAHGLFMHFGNQRTGGIQIEEIARGGICRHGFRHTMSGKHNGLFAVLLRNFVQFLDKNRALGFQPFNDETIMHDFVANIDGRAIAFERQNNNLDCPVNASAKAARAA
jgi:hypothetical protein